MLTAIRRGRARSFGFMRNPDLDPLLRKGTGDRRIEAWEGPGGEIITAQRGQEPLIIRQTTVEGGRRRHCYWVTRDN
jgi:hypothetical protein